MALPLVPILLSPCTSVLVSAQIPNVFMKLELQHTATDPTEDEIVEKLEKLKRNFKEASEYLQSIGWTITATPRRKNRTKIDYIFFFKEAPDNVLNSIPKVIFWYAYYTDVFTTNGPCL